MNRAPQDPLRIVNTLGVWLLALLLLAAVVIQGSALLMLWGVLANLPSVDEVLEVYVDHQVAAGISAAELDEDDPLIASRVVLLDTEVNERIAHDVVARLFYLNELDPETPIDLYISTAGGWVDSAFTIIDAMHLIDAPVNTWAIGGCYSAGAMILTAGTGYRVASSNALIMVHANLDDSDEPLSYDRLARERYERLWNERADLPPEWFPMTGDESYYLGPEEALAYGMVDEVVRIEWLESVEED